MSEPQNPAGRRRFGRAAAAGGVVVVLAAGAGWFLIPPSPARLLERGLAAARRDPSAAESLLRRAVDAAGGRFPDGQIALCSVLAQRESWDEALALFASIDVVACRSDLLLSFGRSAHEARHKNESRKALEELSRRDSRESAAALELLVADYYDCDQLLAAIDAARKWTRHDPHNSRAWAQLGKLLKDVYREDEFVATMREALALDLPDKDHLEFTHRLVDALIVNGDSAAAWPLVEELKQTEGDTARIRGYEIDLYRMEGNPEKALELLKIVFPEIQDDPTAYFTRGTLYLDLSRCEEAVRDLKRVVARQPGNEWAQAGLADALRRLGKTDEARHHREISDRLNVKRARYDKLLRMRPGDPQNPKIYEELAQLSRDLHEPEAARYYEERIARIATGSRLACPPPAHGSMEKSAHATEP